MQSNCRVVLIDDDPISHLISSRMLQRFSTCQVETFIDPVEALAALSVRAQESPESFPSVIFLDIDMPRMDGWEFLEEFEKLPSPVIQKSALFMLSSSAHYSDVEKSKQFTTVRNFFSKPMTEEMLRIIGLSSN